MTVTVPVNVTGPATTALSAIVKSPSIVAAFSKNPSLPGGLFIYKVPFVSAAMIASYAEIASTTLT